MGRNGNGHHAPTDPLFRLNAAAQSVHMPRIMARNIRAHASEFVPQEVCGLIGGTDDHFTMLARAPNHSIDNKHNFRIEPSHAAEILTEFLERDARLRAIYHSHVGTPAVPSLSDINGTPSELYIVIYSVVDDELRVWRGNDEMKVEVYG